jgi:hypothetical protein
VKIPASVLGIVALAAPLVAQVPPLADPRPRLPAGIGAAIGCAAADLDRDGAVDLLRAEDSRLRVLLQVRGGAFHEHPQQRAIDFGTAGPIAAVAVARVDGDQDPDLVVGLRNGADQVLLNDGRGVFTLAVPPPIPPSAFPATLAIIAAELDGRAGDDLLVLAANAPPRLLLANLAGGAPVYVDGTAFLPAVATAPRDAALAVDLDLDGDQDLVLGGGALALALVLWNDGRGDFRRAATSLPSGTPPARQLASADLDRDGRPDLLIAPDGAGPGALAAVLNPGPPGGLVLLVPASIPLPRLTALAAADLDGDRAADAIVLREDGELLALRGRGDGSLFRATGLLGAGPRRALVLADLEGDGDADVFAPGYGIEDSLLLGDGAAGFVDTEARTAPIAARRDARGLALLDLSGEGDPDLLSLGRDGELGCWRNDGGAAFTPDPGIPLPRLPSGGAYSDLVAARLSRGAPAADLVVLGQPSPFHPPGLRALAMRGGVLVDESAQVFAHAWTGRLLTALAAVALGRGPTGDAASDLLVGDSAGEVRLLRRPAAGGVYQELPNALPFVHPGAIAGLLTGDLDGDGAVDLVVLPSGGPPEVQLAVGPSGLMFRRLAGAVPSPGPARAGLLADLDGDGRLDLLLATPRSARGLALLWGIGGGQFVDVSPGELAAVGPVAGAIGFVRLDARRILVGRDGGESLVLIRVGGSGFAAVEVPGRGSRRLHVLRAADLDLDGDLDVAAARSDAEPAILLGTDLQLAAVGRGQAGRILRLRIAGPAGASGFVLVAPRTARTALPGFGVLRLVAPETLALTPLAAWPASIDLAVPAGLPPTDLPLQLVVFEPSSGAVRLGNLEAALVGPH